MAGLVKRLAGPVLFFAAFAAGAAWLADERVRGAVEQRLGAGMGTLAMIVGVGAVLSGAWLVDRLIRLAVWEFGVARATARPVPRLLVQIGSLIVYVIATTAIVGFVFDQPLTGIFAASGLIGIVIGFALRNIILDAFSGIAMNLDQPFAIGEWILV
jgi:small-conductance mechanosensitive channel